MIIKSFKMSSIKDINSLNNILELNLPFKLYSTQLKLLTEIGYKQIPSKDSFLFIKEHSDFYIMLTLSKYNGSSSFSEIHFLISKHFLKKSFDFNLDKISYFLIPSMDLKKPNLITYTDSIMTFYTTNSNISFSEKSFLYNKISTKDFFLSRLHYFFNQPIETNLKATFMFKGSVIDLSFIKTHLPELSININLENFENFETTLTENDYLILEAFLFK